MVAFLFILGLMAKPMLVTLALMLILGYWPLRRMSLFKSFYRKIPMIFFRCACTVAFHRKQKAGSAVVQSKTHSARFMNGSSHMSLSGKHSAPLICPFSVLPDHIPWWQVLQRQRHSVGNNCLGRSE
jgi:hypothetical protein